MLAILTHAFLIILITKLSKAYNDSFQQPKAIIYLDDVPVKINLLNLKPAVRARAAKARDIDNERGFRGKGGAIDYGASARPPLSDHRATGIKATITKSIIDANPKIGTCAYGNMKPPGFETLQGKGACAQRGHLLANMLGGSGLDVRNIVTVTSLVNNPGMSDLEKMVRDVWKNGHIGPRCNVEYEVQPSYAGTQQHPIEITLKATVVDPNDPHTKFEWFNRRIINLPIPSTSGTLNDIEAYRRAHGDRLDCNPKGDYCKKRKFGV